MLPYSGWAFLGLLTDLGGRGGAGAKSLPPSLSIICHTHPTLMKLSTVIPYLKKIQKIHKSHDTPLDSYQHFFTENQQFLVYQEIQV